MSALLPLSSSYSKPLLPSFSHCDLPNCLLPPSFHTQLFLTPGFCLIPHIEAKPYTAMMFHRSQSQMGYMISSTSQPHMEIGAVPILQMMKTEAKKDEITCLKPHSYGEAEARWCLVFFFSFQLYKSQGIKHDNLHISLNREQTFFVFEDPRE